MDMYEGQFHQNVIASDTQAVVCSGLIVFDACFKLERAVLGISVCVMLQRSLLLSVASSIATCLSLNFLPVT